MIAIAGNRQLANQHHKDCRTALGAGAGIDSSGDRMADALDGRAGRSTAGWGCQVEWSEPDLGGRIGWSGPGTGRPAG